MNILIRADGGVNIGLGHIMRTLALADELKSENNVTYICNNKDEFNSGREFIKDKKYKIIEIDEEREVDEIKKIPGNILIIDKYDVDEEYLKSLSDNFVVMYVDDNNELSYYPVDIVLNHNLYGNRFKYKSVGKIIAGSKYTLIRNEFRKYKPINIKSKAEKMLITVGGSDKNNLTKRIVDTLPEDEIEKHIVVTNAFIYREELCLLNRRDLIIHCNPNMAELMSKMDFAISACGSTINELAYLGIPTIGVVVADNQINLAKYMNENNAIILSDINSIDKYYRELDLNTRIKLNENMQYLVDGNGVARIKEVIYSFEK